MVYAEFGGQTECIWAIGKQRIDINQIDVIFFAIIITSVYDRFAKGASRVLISLLLFSYKYGICSLFTVKCNFGVVPGWGLITLF